MFHDGRPKSGKAATASKRKGSKSAADIDESFRPAQLQPLEQIRRNLAGVGVEGPEWPLGLFSIRKKRPADSGPLSRSQKIRETSPKVPRIMVRAGEKDPLPEQRWLRVKEEFLSFAARFAE